MLQKEKSFFNGRTGILPEARRSEPEIGGETFVYVLLPELRV
jgi:hypothetical protein